MARRFSNAVNCVRIAFFTLNCIFWVISLAVFALGAWLLYVREEHDYDVITGSGSIVSGASLLVLGGGVAVVVAALGMVGAYGMWRPVIVTVSKHSHKASQPHQWIEEHIGYFKSAITISPLFPSLLSIFYWLHSLRFLKYQQGLSVSSTEKIL
jgi:hypothetical protein